MKAEFTIHVFFLTPDLCWCLDRAEKAVLIFTSDNCIIQISVGKSCSEMPGIPLTLLAKQEKS